MDIHRDREIENNSYVYSHVCGKSSNKYAVGKDISIILIIIINTTVKLIKNKTKRRKTSRESDCKEIFDKFISQKFCVCVCVCEWT